MRSLAGIRQYADVSCVEIRKTRSGLLAIGDRDPVPRLSRAGQRPSLWRFEWLLRIAQQFEV